MSFGAHGAADQSFLAFVRFVPFCSFIGSLRAGSSVKDRPQCVYPAFSK